LKKALDDLDAIRAFPTSPEVIDSPRLYRRPESVLPLVEKTLRRFGR
jgi:hypothetical protein